MVTLPVEPHTGPGDLRYAPLAGVGSRIIAGERTGRRVHGLERSEVFCDVIVERWQAFTGKTAGLDSIPEADTGENRLGRSR